MAKKKENGYELRLLKEIPDRFKGVLTENDELYHLRAKPNQSQVPVIEGFKHRGTGDGGFYFVKS